MKKRQQKAKKKTTTTARKGLRGKGLWEDEYFVFYRFRYRALRLRIKSTSFC